MATTTTADARVGGRVAVPDARTQPDEWIQAYQGYIYSTIVMRALPPKDGETVKEATERQATRVELVGQYAMDQWTVSVTHETFDPNPDSNYETLENRGDAVIELAYNDYMQRIYPDLNQSDLGNLRNYYVSKPALARLSRRLGIPDWVRTGLPVNISVAEDVFEAVCGCLFLLGNQVIGVGGGYLLAYNFMESLFDDVEIDRRVLSGHPKTQVKEIFEGAGWLGARADKRNVDELETWIPDVAATDTTPASTSGTLTLTFTPEAIDTLKRRHIRFNPVFVTTKGRTRKVASDAAYRYAVTVLERMGYQREARKADKTLREISMPQYAQYAPAAINKAKSAGITELTFYATRMGNDFYGQLLGKTNEDRKVILATAYSDVNEADAKLEALRLYVE